MNIRLIVLTLCASLSAPAMARAQECAPVVLAPAAAPTAARVRDYAPIFQHCARGGATRLATRRMTIDGEAILLTVDPQSLTTSLESAQCWRCAETSDAEQSDTRLMRAIRPPEDPSRPPALVNAGLIHGRGAGSYVTGDLCPTKKPLERGFLDLLAQTEPGAPVTLAISGSWLAHHDADFAWLQEQARAGRLTITWANHSYSHPYVPGLADQRNYLLRPGVDLDDEIFETEKLLIAHGETPSVFFRFPGLVADAALLEGVRARHLVALGSDSWLALGPPPRPGSIVLVHPNGNEPAGLKLFSQMLTKDRMPRPFRPINEAP